MRTITVPVFEVSQPVGSIFVAKMDAQDLLRMSSVDRRHIDEDDEAIGIQRPLRQDKVREIKKYLTTQNATFPNSIIVNLNKGNVVRQTAREIEIVDDENAFTIIDGQHRLYGFEDYSGRRFELIIAIFVGLDITLQAEIFSIINSQQTKVDPSLNVNLELQDDTENPKKKLVQIAQSFNMDKKSPWYQQIRMLGSQSSGTITLASFVRPLFDLTFPDKLWIPIKSKLKASLPDFPSFDDMNVDDRRFPFWPFYVSQQPEVIYKILLNFFNALKSNLPKDWMNPDSILNKTTGYNAIIRLLRSILPIGFEKGDLSEQFFYVFLSPLSSLDGTITAMTYGSSGLYASNLLYRDMMKELKLPLFDE